MASLCKKCRHGREHWDECGCQWMIRSRVGGREVYRSAGTVRADAERALARGNLAAEETVAAALDAWYRAKEREPGARPNSLGSYPGRIARAKRWFGPMLVRQVRPEHLTQFVADLLGAGLAPSTVRGIYSVLTGSLRHAVRRGVIKVAPVPPDGPGIPQAARREHALTLPEVERVIGRLEDPWDRVAEVILLTGLRWGEVVALEPGDIEGHVLRVRRTRNRYGGTNAPKTRSGVRVIPLSPRAEHLLHELSLPVAGEYWRAYDALEAALGSLHRPGMGWHTLRNAHASLLEAAGVTLRDQAARMGHGTNYAQTLAYGLVVEAGSADQLDAARRHASPSPDRRPALDELAARRARRARRRPAP